MPITSHDSLVSALTSGQAVGPVPSLKTTTPVHTVNGWHLLAGLAGSGGATTYPGTDLLWAHCDEFGGDGTTAFGIPHGGAMAGSATKHLTRLSAMMVAAAGAPWTAQLVDLLGYYRLSGANVTGAGGRTCLNDDAVVASSGGGDMLLTYTRDFKNLTRVRFTTSNTLPTGLSLSTTYWLVRQSSTTSKVSTSYANALAGTYVTYTDNGVGTHTATIRPRGDGVGAQAMFVVQTAPTSGGPNMTASAYTNSGGTGSRAFQGTPSFGAAADAYAARVPHSGTGSGRNQYLPLQGGDAGILKIDSFTLSGGTPYTGSGVMAVCLVKPIGPEVPLPATGVVQVIDTVNQVPSLDKIEDGACLAWMLWGTGATTNNSPFSGTLSAVWAG